MSNATPITIMLVDDHAMLRHGMAMLINAQHDLKVIAEAEDGESAMQQILDGIKPSIILIDLSLKKLSGFDLLKKIKELAPAIPMLIVSMHDETIYAERALHSGAMGYVMKQAPGETLIQAIRQVACGKVFLSSAVENLIASGGNTTPSSPHLTASELEVLHLIGAGHSSQEIATLLNRSIKTIEAHRANMRNKLKLKDGADLIRYATRWIENTL